jgi:hypothetical protein
VRREISLAGAFSFGILFGNEFAISWAVSFSGAGSTMRCVIFGRHWQLDISEAVGYFATRGLFCILRN